MTEAEWEFVEALFADTADLTPREREALLDGRCADRPDLRAEVTSLLAAHDRAEAFLQRIRRAGLDGE